MVYEETAKIAGYTLNFLSILIYYCCTATYLLSQKLYKYEEQDMRDADGEARTNSFDTFFYGSLHMDVVVFADEQELIYIKSVWTHDVVWKTCRERWMIVTDR